MDVGLSEGQEMLRRSARVFLDAECSTEAVRNMEASNQGFSRELWRKMAGLGWLGLSYPSRYGGTDGGPMDQVVLFEETGRALLPGPVLTSSVLCGHALLDVGSDEQRSRLLPAMAAGDIIVAPAGLEPAGGLDGAATDLRVSTAGEGYTIDGAALFVPFADSADYFICQANAQSGEILLLVDRSADGVSLTPMESGGTHRQSEIRMAGVRVPADNVLGWPGGASKALAGAVRSATIAQCADMVGRAEKVLELVVDYAKVRVQFGRPIGSFQAVAHRCADLQVGVDGARLLTHQAAWRLAEGLDCDEDIAMAKARAGDLSRQATEAGHAIFAGIAFAVEHDMHLYTLRSKIAEASLGDTDLHLDRLASSMGF